MIYSINLALFYFCKGGLHIAKLNVKQQSGYEIKPDMKALLEIEYPSGADGLTNRLSLGSYVEEVMPDGCVLIQVPVYRGFNYPLPRDVPILMYLMSKTCMFSMTVRFIEHIRRDGLTFAKVRGCSDIKPDQRRSCYRLPCELHVTVKRVPANAAYRANQVPPPLSESQMINFSDSGMLFAANETFDFGDKVNLAFDIGTDETIAAEVLRCERVGRAETEPKNNADAGNIETNPIATGTTTTDSLSIATEEVKTYRYKIAVKFAHKCKKQKDRFYKYIVNQQFERIKRQAEQNALRESL